jgi:hypothetical protein
MISRRTSKRSSTEGAAGHRKFAWWRCAASFDRSALFCAFLWMCFGIVGAHRDYESILATIHFMHVASVEWAVVSHSREERLIAGSLAQWREDAKIEKMFGDVTRRDSPSRN